MSYEIADLNRGHTYDSEDYYINSLRPSDAYMRQ